MKTKAELLEELRREIDEVTPDEVGKLGKQSAERVILDVREAHEFAAGHLPGALHISRGFLEIKIESHVADRQTPIVAYCGGGTRSLLAADTLKRMGYQNVVSMAGGFRRWKEQGHEVLQPKVLNEAERSRYERHLSIPEVGEAGQLKLMEARVLLVGAGGLGCPAAYYLAAAGVGELGIVDFDAVDESNLQRQILHTTGRVGQPKTASAKETLQALNPLVQVNAIEAKLTSDNVEEIFSGYDIVVDGSDNFPTRYLVNDACVKLGIANVHGSVYRFEGQVTVFHPPAGPCYRCLYPEPPPAELAPSCAEAGVLGVLPGVVGLLEAVETIKLILNKGESLVGRLLQYDALKTEFRTLKLRRDPECHLCAEGKSFPGYVDYQAFCANPTAVQP